MAIRDANGNAQALAAAAEVQDLVFVHPQAVVEHGAIIGDGTKIWRFAHVRSDAYIGKHCILGNNVFIDAGVRIGDHVKIQNACSVYAGVTIEDEVFVGPNVTFTNDRYPRAMNTDWQIVPTRICHGASLGANSTIVCGITIGLYAMVAAGSVVTKDVAPLTLVRGNPARAVGYVCPCGEKIGTLEMDITVPHRCECGCLIDLEHARVLL